LHRPAPRTPRLLTAVLATALKIAATICLGMLVLPVFVAALVLLALLYWFDEAAQVIRRIAWRR
jgi:hypothetical protein